MATSASTGFSGFADARYLNLETYRRDGTGVRTPLWFAAPPDMAKLYIYSTADAGKVKRIRRNGAARIARSDVRGNVTGPWLDVFANFVTGEEFELGMRLLNQKYFPWKQLLNLSAMLFRHRERVVFAIRPCDP